MTRHLSVTATARVVPTGHLALLSGIGGIVLALLATALPGHATNFTPPSGCTLELTAQNRSCSVTQYYRCSADPSGDQRSAIFGKDGLRHLSWIDAETRWMESTSPDTGLTDVLVQRSKDHASFSTLLETGSDDFDFWTESNTGERLRHVGRDDLTGKKVTIDGMALEETRFQLKTYDNAGELLIERTGQQFISREHGRFFGGVEEQSDWTGQDQKTNDTPVLFSLPGEEGFGDTEPKFDCEEIMAQSSIERAQL